MVCFLNLQNEIETLFKIKKQQQQNTVPSGGQSRESHFKCLRKVSQLTYNKYVWDVSYF